MLTTLRVKTWLKNKDAQFEVVQEDGGVIIIVNRIRDDMTFTLKALYRVGDDNLCVHVEFMKFLPDLINVVCRVHYDDCTISENCTTPINEIELHQDEIDDSKNWKIFFKKVVDESTKS